MGSGVYGAGEFAGHLQGRNKEMGNSGLREQ